MDGIYLALASTIAASFLLAEALVLTAARHGQFTMDWPGGIHKLHSRPTPRVGGVGIYAGLLVAQALAPPGETAEILGTLLVAGSAALLAGLLEDVTKRVGVRARLAATIASGILACALSGVTIVRLDVPVLDQALAIAPIALVFTGFCVGGLANAVNIIDGCNGLASGTAGLCLLALAAIAAAAGDIHLAVVAVIVAAAVTGFWLVNFPWGRLFLGDGGAYFAGFALAWLAVLLPARNASVSPWASLLVCAYPIIEVLYSVVRRAVHHRSAASADCAHLHSLLATKFMRKRFPALSPVLQNSAVSVIMWLFAAAPALIAVAFHSRTSLLVVAFVACAVAYHLIYRKVANP